MKKRWLKLKKFFRKNKKLLTLFFLLTILPAVIILAQTVTKLRSKAAPSTPPQSYLMFEPKTDKTVFGQGEEFEVNIALDTISDSMAVVGTDILINYPKQLKAISITSGTVFDNFTQQEINETFRQIKLSASNQNIKNNQGYPNGYTGHKTVATVKFKAINLGKSEISFVYHGQSSTNDTNIIGFKKEVLVGQQSPKERLLQTPGGWTFEVIKEPIPSPSPKPIISPRPIPIPSPSLAPSPSPQPRPQAQIQLQLSLLDRIYSDVDGRQVGTNKPASTQLNYMTTGTLYGVDAGQVKGVMIASEFGSMLKKQPKEWVGPPLKERKKHQGENEERIKEWVGPPLKQATMVKLGTFVTNMAGRVTITIPEKYEGKRMYLFVRTPSHLLKASNRSVILPKVSDCLWKTKPYCAISVTSSLIRFENLVPGDIYIAEGQTQQDNLINSFDAIELIRNLGKTAKLAMPDFKCIKAPCNPPHSTIHYHKADLNGDEVVNVRDLKILLKYMGKTGDSYQELPHKVTYCQTDNDCQGGQKCYQPPMPTCPEGFACSQVMPKKYCNKWGN